MVNRCAMVSETCGLGAVCCEENVACNRVAQDTDCEQLGADSNSIKRDQVLYHVEHTEGGKTFARTRCIQSFGRLGAEAQGNDKPVDGVGVLIFGNADMAADERQASANGNLLLSHRRRPIRRPHL